MGPKSLLGTDRLKVRNAGRAADRQWQLSGCPISLWVAVVRGRPACGAQIELEVEGIFPGRASFPTKHPDTQSSRATASSDAGAGRCALE
jgi:hypothetical protein